MIAQIKKRILQKFLERPNTLQTPSAILGLLVAILDFSSRAALQVVSENPQIYGIIENKQHLVEGVYQWSWREKKSMISLKCSSARENID